MILLKPSKSRKNTCYYFGCSGLLYIIVFALMSTSNAIQWLVLSRAGSIASIGTPSVCDQLSQTLVSKQVKFCKKHPGFMLSVQTGASRAIDECKFQFRTRRWNCSTLDEIKQTPSVVPLQPEKKKKHVNRDVYLNSTQSDGPYQTSGGKKSPSSSLFRPNPVVPAGTREAAFVHAISAAGVAHALTRACSAGELEDCGCDRSVRGISPDGFEWAGCSDNVHFGTSFSRNFVDAREHSMSRKKPKRKASDKHVWLALMNLHNNEAGRKIIEKSMRIECKCHGVSGSCELRTCWKAMPSFREIGEQLKDKFDSATEVEPRVSSSGSRRQLMPRSPSYKLHTDTDLVYLERSPDYCDFNEKTGSLGTRGRVCNKTSRAIDGCELLCCNRGYRSFRERRVERCNCKFQWCCSVHCKTCIRDVEVHVCE